MVFAEDVKKKYEALQNKNLTAQEFIKSLEKDAEAVESEIMSLVTEAVDSTRRLQQIALRPTTVYNTDYIDILIKAENNTPDCEQRIRFLQQLREQAKILSKIESGVRLADLKLWWTRKLGGDLVTAISFPLRSISYFKWLGPWKTNKVQADIY